MTRRSVALDWTQALAKVATDVARLRDEVALLSDLPAVVAAHGRALTDLGDLAHQAAGRRPGSAQGSGAAAREVGVVDTDDGSGAGGTTSSGAGAATDEAADPPPAWLTVSDPALAIAWLNELAVWVPAVWQLYLQTKTPDCWPWHPDAVAELLVVQHQWIAATADGAGVDPLATWHDRWRPGAAHRLLKRLAGCDRAYGHHKAGSNAREYDYDIACLDELAEWWATTHGTDPTRPAPGLTLADGAR